ncbi:MAG: ribosome biogenesis GTPase Der [Malacoplasma sp.]
MLTVAIVGKPNVGKSTLFNRILKINKSIVDDAPGVTRDRIYGDANWLTRDFKIIDTGGLLLHEFDFKKQIEMQVNFAITEADVIIFLLSAKDGIDNDDIYVSKVIKKYKGKKIILAVNKIDGKETEYSSNDFYNVGFGEAIFISSEHGIGIGDLLDKIITTSDNKHDKVETYKFCIIGRPNVGKSSLVNCILNKERVIVSNISGTTRDSIDTTFKKNKELFTIIDTAGIKKLGKIKENVDKYSYIRVEQSIKRSDLIVIMLDGSEEFTEQDEVIAGLAYKANIPAIIAVNKWDIVQKDDHTMSAMTKKIRILFKFLPWAPIVYLSATENSRINSLFEEIKIIQEMAKKKITSSALTELVKKAQMMNNSPSFNQGRLKINYVTQVNGQIPTFVLFCNNPEFLHFSYSRYLENEIKENFNFTKVPITLYFKPKNSIIK